MKLLERSILNQLMDILLLVGTILVIIGWFVQTQPPTRPLIDYGMIASLVALSLRVVIDYVDPPTHRS